MAYVNEYIPEEDKKKHNMNEANHFYRAGTVSWTVDREKNIFLLQRTGGGPESPPGETDWAFYWRGHLLDVRLREIARGGDANGGHGWEHTRVLSIGGLTPELQQRRADILSDLKEALTGHRGSGIYSRRVTYEVRLDAPTSNTERTSSVAPRNVLESRQRSSSPFECTLARTN